MQPQLRRLGGCAAGFQGVATDQPGLLFVQHRTHAGEGLGQQLLLIAGVKDRQGHDRLGAVHGSTAGPEVRTGMQSRQASVQPGIAEQGREPVHALQQWWVTGNLSGIFRCTAKPHLLKGGFQRLRRQLGCTAATGHRAAAGHRLGALKSSHEPLIDVSLPSPQQRHRPQLPISPPGPGLSLLVADELQRRGLGVPGPQGLLGTTGLEVVGQRGGGPHGPDAGGGSRCRGENGAVACGKQVLVADHLQAGIRAHPAVAVDG